MPKLVDHEQRRNDILDATATVIAAEGIEAATVRRIAAEGNCTTGLVTHYFASKDDLLIGAIRQVHARTAERMRGLVQEQTGMQALRAVLGESLPIGPEGEAEWRVWLAYWGTAWTSQPLIAEHRERYAAWRGLITRLLSEAAGDGETRPGLDLEAEADRLIAVADGLGIQAVYNPGHMTPERLLAVIDAEIAQLS